MRIAVAGGTSHTGERLVRRLLRGGHDVTVLTRDPASAPAAALAELGAKLRRADVRRPWEFLSGVEGAEALVSLLHIRHAPVCLAACDRAGIRRYVQTSSARGLSRLAGDPTIRPVRLGERAVAAWRGDWTILRPTMIYGGVRDRNLERLFQWFLRRRWFPLFGAGRYLVQPVYADDVVAGVVGALERPGRWRRRAVDLGGPRPLPYRRLVEEVARAAGVERPVLLPVPREPGATALALAGRLPRLGLLREVALAIRRTGEDRTVDVGPMTELIGRPPVGLARGLEEKRARGRKHP